jgi:hypothetical protein
MSRYCIEAVTLRPSVRGTPSRLSSQLVPASRSPALEMRSLGQQPNGKEPHVRDDGSRNTLKRENEWARRPPTNGGHAAAQIEHAICDHSLCARALLAKADQALAR